MKGTEFSFLLPTQTGEHGSQRAEPDPIKPLMVSISGEDSSIIQLEFKAGALARGWCHMLMFTAQGNVDFDQILLQNDLKLCTSNCLCDSIGSSGCDETNGTCICRYPHTGPGCSECDDGHVKDPTTGQCNPSSKCKDDGGEEDCNGHGTCKQHGGHAMCECNSGFTHDGLSQCSRCLDPLFLYPNCQLRNFIIEEPSLNCRYIKNDMPTSLFKESPEYKEGGPVQSDDGTLNWEHRYRLHNSESELVKRSTHYFKIATASVLRFFVDNVKSDVAVKYRIFDGDNE